MFNLNNDDKEILEAISKNYHVSLTSEQYEDFIDWYAKNYDNFTSENDIKIRKYLAKYNNGQIKLLMESDTSNISYMLSLLNERAKKK